MMPKMPMMMGAMMGLMVPFMVMGAMPVGGLAFVLAHVAIVGGAVLVAWLGLRFGRPSWAARMRRMAGHHRPQIAHALPFGLAFAVSFGVVHLGHMAVVAGAS